MNFFLMELAFPKENPKSQEEAKKDGKKAPNEKESGQKKGFFRRLFK